MNAVNSFSSPNEARLLWTELAPEAAARSLAQFQIVDVREPDEFYGDLGHLEGSRLVPLGRLADTLDQLDRERAVLVVCRSGRRGVAACERLAAAGFTELANLAGGMLAWNAGGLSVCAQRHAAVDECQVGAVGGSR